MPLEKPVCSGLVERIGLENSIITHKTYLNRDEKIIKKTIDLSDHEEGLKEVAALLTDPETGVIKNPGEIEVVGHRVVHGGETFAVTTIITNKVKDKIQKSFSPCAIAQPGKLYWYRSSRKNFHEGKTDCGIRYGVSSDFAAERHLPMPFPNHFILTTI